MWHIRLTLHFLAEAGSLLDCVRLADSSLKHFQRPDVEVIGDEVTVVCVQMNLKTEHYYIITVTDSSHQHLPSERAPVPLAIHRVGVNSSECPKGIMRSSEIGRGTT